MENRYKIYKNGYKYDIYSIYGQFIVSCTNEETAIYIVNKLNKEDILKRGQNGR